MSSKFAMVWLTGEVVTQERAIEIGNLILDEFQNRDKAGVEGTPTPKEMACALAYLGMTMEPLVKIFKVEMVDESDE
jgi:hypothetical protein